MEYICHRINKAKELKEIPSEYGVELDLRDNLDGRIYIEHNPFIAGEDFEEYLKSYKHGTLILNIKSERIEETALELIEKYNIRSYFFLDSSFPMIYLMSKIGITKTAIRFSEFEGMDTIEAMAGRAEWIWVDCFTKMPLDSSNYSRMKELGYKICLVSPELQMHPEKISEYAEHLRSLHILPDAICAKSYNIPKWKSLLED